MKIGLGIRCVVDVARGLVARDDVLVIFPLLLNPTDSHFMRAVRLWARYLCQRAEDDAAVLAKAMMNEGRIICIDPAVVVNWNIDQDGWCDLEPDFDAGSGHRIPMQAWANYLFAHMLTSGNLA